MSSHAQIYKTYATTSGTAYPVLNGATIDLWYQNQAKRTFTKDELIFPMPKPKSKWKEGAETIALDILKINKVWELTGTLKDVSAFTISDEKNETSGLDEWVLVGAPHLTAYTVKTTGGSAYVENTDYKIDTNKGLVKPLTGGTMSANIQFHIDYVANGGALNQGQCLLRMLERGGDVSFAYRGTSYTCQITRAEWREDVKSYRVFYTIRLVEAEHR